ALPLAVVAGRLVAAAEPLAVVHAGAAMGLHGGAAPLPRAVVLGARSVPLAVVEAAAEMLLGTGRRHGGEQRAAGQQGSGDHTTQGGKGQLAEVPPAHVIHLHGSGLLSYHFIW